MKKKILFILIVSFLLVAPQLVAQKWGKVSKEVQTMTCLPEDPEANAVILFDKNEVRITRQFDLRIKRHKRIKILTEEGKDLANIEIPFYKEDFVSNVQAQTILPDGNKIELEKINIFEEKTGTYSNHKVFAIPGVEVGSVIEYKYLKTSRYLVLRPWLFQNSEFTKKSELTIWVPDGFKYTTFYQ